MTSYHFALEGNILKTRWGVPASNDQIVCDAAAQLHNAIATGELPGGPLLLINGPASVPVSYTIADQLASLYDAIAIFDPKLGSRAINRYVVVISRTSLYRVGEVWDVVNEKQYDPIKVVICGPPHSGKSCLREGLKQAILALYRIGKAPYPWVVTACPDGEGAWFSEAVRHDSKMAEEHKKSYKAKFTWEVAQQRARWVERTNQPLNIIDVGGAASPQNRLIMSQATHAIILSRDREKIQEWRNFCEELGLKTLAEISSHLNDRQDIVETEVPILRGSIYGVKRGEDISCRPIVQALARILTQQLKKPN